MSTTSAMSNGGKLSKRIRRAALSLVHRLLFSLQVMVMTAQIFVHLIDHGLFAMEKANLLVFDECHHALGKQHPYRVIMDRYRRLEPGNCDTNKLLQLIYTYSIAMKVFL